MRVVRICTEAWPLIKRAPYLASAADDIMLRSILHNTNVNPFRTRVYLLKLVFSGLVSLSKYTPLARLVDLAKDK